MNRRFAAAVCGAWFAVSAVTLLVANEGSFPLSEFVKDRFVQTVSAGLKDYRVCEAFSPDEDKRQFFKKTFDVDVFSGAMSFQSREIFVEHGAGKDLRRSHLGILTLRYTSPQDAERIRAALDKQGGFFKGREVLTRFSTVSADNDVLVVYSESVQDERVKSFLETIEKQVKAKPSSSH